MAAEQKLVPGKRETVYDWIRLFATLLVVLGHSFYLSNFTALGAADYMLSEEASRILGGGLLGALEKASHFVYLFHMPLFFILSGAVLALRPIPDMGKLVRSKVRRLLVPYWVYSLLFMLPIKFLGDFYLGKTVPQVLFSFLLGGEDGHLWFLPALFWCILLFAGIRKICAKVSGSVYLPLAVCLILAPALGGPMGSALQFRTGVSYL